MVSGDQEAEHMRLGGKKRDGGGAKLAIAQEKQKGIRRNRAWTDDTMR